MTKSSTLSAPVLAPASTDDSNEQNEKNSPDPLVSKPINQLVCSSGLSNRLQREHERLRRECESCDSVDA